MATNPTPQPDFLSTLKREAGAFGQAFNPATALAALYHAASDAPRPDENAAFERSIGPTGRLIDRSVVQPTLNAVRDYAGGKVSYDDVLQNLPEALGGAGGTTALGGVVSSAAGATPIGPAALSRTFFAPRLPSVTSTPAVSEIPPSLKAVIGPKMTSAGDISWPDSYTNPPEGGGGNYNASDLESLKTRMGLNAPQARATAEPEIPQVIRDAAGLERREIPRTAPMNAMELEDAIKNRKPISTPFNYTQGARETISRDPLMPRYPGEMLQGGHAGNGVASVEELSRPGQHYVVSRTGALTFQDQRGAALAGWRRIIKRGAKKRERSHLSFYSVSTVLVSARERIAGQMIGTVRFPEN
jgi:hypothetical protein